MLLSGVDRAVHFAQTIIPFAFARSAIVMHIDSRVDSDEFTNCDPITHLSVYRLNSVILSRNGAI